MSIYKDLIGKDLAPKNKNTSQKLFYFQSGELDQKILPIWECFFAFIVCRENTYISMLLAIIFIHKTNSIIFIGN